MAPNYTQQYTLTTHFNTNSTYTWNGDIPYGPCTNCEPNVTFTKSVPPSSFTYRHHTCENCSHYLTSAQTYYNDFNTTYRSIIAPPNTQFTTYTYAS